MNLGNCKGISNLKMQYWCTDLSFVSVFLIRPLQGSRKDYSCLWLEPKKNGLSKTFYLLSKDPGTKRFTNASKSWLLRRWNSPICSPKRKNICESESISKFIFSPWCYKKCSLFCVAICSSPAGLLLSTRQKCVSSCFSIGLGNKIHPFLFGTSLGLLGWH